MLNQKGLASVLSMIDEARSTVMQPVETEITEPAGPSKDLNSGNKMGIEPMTFDKFEQAIASTGNVIAKAITNEVESWMKFQKDSPERHNNIELSTHLEQKIRSEILQLGHHHSQLRHSLEEEIVSSIHEIAEHGASAEISLPEWPEMELRLKASLASFSAHNIHANQKNLFDFGHPSRTEHHELDQDIAESIFRDAMSSSSTHFQSAIDICKVLATCDNINDAHFPTLEIIDSDDEDAEGLDPDMLEAETGVLDTNSVLQEHEHATDDLLPSCSEAIDFSGSKTGEEDETYRKWQSVWARYGRLAVFMMVMAVLYQLYFLAMKVKRSAQEELDLILDANHKALAASMTKNTKS